MKMKNLSKKKKCVVCGTEFDQYNSLQKVCGINCSIKYSKKKNEIQRKKDERKRMDLMKEELMTTSDWKLKLQKTFNEFIRIRDKEKGCISCGTSLINRKFDAGHFYASTYEGLRYNELNVHGQCVPCNRNLHGNIHEYRKRITNRITPEQLKWLDDNRHAPLRLKVYEIKELITEYKQKIKQLKNGSGIN